MDKVLQGVRRGGSEKWRGRQHLVAAGGKKKSRWEREIQRWQEGWETEVFRLETKKRLRVEEWHRASVNASGWTCQKQKWWCSARPGGHTNICQFPQPVVPTSRLLNEEKKKNARRFGNKRQVETAKTSSEDDGAGVHQKGRVDSQFGRVNNTVAVKWKAAKFRCRGSVD